MEEAIIISDKANKEIDFTSDKNNLLEKQFNKSLVISENKLDDAIRDTKCSELNDYIVQLNDENSIMNTSAYDNLLSSTAADNSYLSEDEFDLKKIKHEAQLSMQLITDSSHFKNENSLDLDYDCSDLNVGTSFEINANNSFDHPDMFIHEEIFSENSHEKELNANGEVPLNTEMMCKENLYDNIESMNFSQVLSDHNYMGREINTIHSELSIKSLNDLKNYSIILNRFITGYERNTELNSLETEKLIVEMSENLNILKNTINTNSSKAYKDIKNIENKDLHNDCLVNDNNYHNTYINENPVTEVEMQSLIFSENCSEPLEYENNNLLEETHHSNNSFDKNECTKLENDDENIKLLNQISTFGLSLVDFSKTFSTASNKNLRDFLSEKYLEYKKILDLNTNTVFVQTDYSGKIYSENRLKKINANEKYRLLNDSSSCSSSSLVSYTDNDRISHSDMSSETDDEIKSDCESLNSYNGIDLSEYIEKPDFDKDQSEPINNGNIEDITKNLENCNKQSNDTDLSNKINNTVLNGTDINNKTEGNDEIEEREINRLLDFKSLGKKKVSLIQYTYNDSEKSAHSTKKKSEKLLQIMEYSKTSELSDGSNSDIEDNLTTEKEFLVRRNEDLKQSLLDTSSSESEDYTENIKIENENNDSNSSLVMKFLETYETENEKDDDQQITELDSSLLYDDSHYIKDGIIEIDRNENIHEITEIKDEENNKKIPVEVQKASIFDKSFILKPIKKKSFESLLTEDERRRKKYNEELISLSSDESEIEENKLDDTQHSRILRPMMRQDQLASETKVAQKEENNRILRLKNKENILKKAFKEHKIDRSNKKELILDYDVKTKRFIKVHPDLFKHLKQHQIEGIKFMYDACYGSVNFTNEHPGSGCILAHCMGLGKTLQLIALLHTVISNKELKTSKILVLCPKSTIMNWADEISRWLAPLKVTNIKIFTFNDTSDIQTKLGILKEWASSGKLGYLDSGCLLIGYEAFRTLVLYHTYRKRSNTQSDLDRIQRTVKETLLQPDLVVCDEGHIIKNRKAAISQAVTEITTRRRIVLTGTPIQNNLKEYYSMVNFIKPSFLGTEKEFANLYANPIRYGQHKDSSKRDIKIMKQRSFVLHKKLSSFVQRREAALLKTFLPQKFEYVLFVPLSKVQTKLYEIFQESVAKRDDSKGRSLLTDYTCLRKIWTHPKVLENAWKNATMKQKKEKKNTNNISDDDEPDDIYDSQTGLMSVTSDWWRTYLTKQDLESILPSNKLQAMFEILKMCEENREKCLIFSAFVAVLNVVEYFMQLINNKEFTEKNEDLGIDKFKGPWINGKDYYRLDGKTSKSLRHDLVKSFNNPNNTRARVFLISAKAGGQGINLIGANRVLILDTSWNPSNDQQNIFRVFRLGQTKNCYIYRLISLGTMEEKVYSRSVTKQAMSFRVVDEHQIDRHYSMSELAELYTLTYYAERPVPFLPQDSILANLLRNHPNLVYKYHEHDSLLENKIEQELSEQEKEDAWLAYERDTNPNAPVPEGMVIPQLGRFDVYGSPSYGNQLPENPFNNLSEIPFNPQGILNQSPFLSGYGFPTNDSYLDSMYKMYQSAQNFTPSMSNNGGRVGIGNNILPQITNYADTLSSLTNNKNISNELNNINQSPYNTSLYSPSVLNQFNHSTFMENIQKTFENYPINSNNNAYTGQRIQKPKSSSVQNNQSYPSSYLSNDPNVLGSNTTSADAIPTSVIMKNDALLKQFNKQIKSVGVSDNRHNFINRASTVRPVLKGDNTNILSQDNNNSALVKGKNKKIINDMDVQQAQQAANQNYITVSSAKQSIPFNNKVSAMNTHIDVLKEPAKDKNKEGNSVTGKPSGILLIQNQTNQLLNNKTAGLDNISGLSNSMIDKSVVVTKTQHSLPTNYNNKSHMDVTNKNLTPPQFKNYDSKISVNAVKSGNLTGPRSSQQKLTSNDEKLNNILTFNSTINHNVVKAKVQEIKGRQSLPTQALTTKAKQNSDLTETGKNLMQSTTISNLLKANDKSIANKFFNSATSITPVRKRIVNTGVGNKTPQIENVATLQITKQQDQRKRPSTNFQLSTNSATDGELIKRQKLTAGNKNEISNRTQNNFKL